MRRRARLPALAPALVAACVGASGCEGPAIEPPPTPAMTFAPPEEAALDQLLLPSSSVVALDRPARVVAVDGGEVVIDAGRLDGVEARMTFDVLRPATVVELPLSEEVVYRPHEPFARAVVRFVDDHRATATLVALEGVEATTAAVGTGMVAVAVHQSTPAALPAAIRPPEEPLEGRYGWPIRLRIRSDAAPADGVRYRWKTSSGWLAADVTVEPENELFPRLGDERAQVEVVAAGREGRAARVVLDVTLKPPARAARPATIGHVLLGARGHVSDVATNEAGDVYLLVRRPDGTILLHRDARGREVGRASAGTWDLSGLAITGRGVHVLQAGHVVRFPPVEPFSALFGSVARLLARAGQGNGDVRRAVDLVATGSGHVFVLDAERGAIQLFAPGGRFLASFGESGTTMGTLERPVALSVRDDDVVALDDGARKALLRYRRCALISEARVGGPGSKLVGVALDPVEPITYVLDAAAGVIKKASAEGSLIGRIDPGPGLGRLIAPTRLRVDCYRRLYVVDAGTVARFFPDGTFVGRWGLAPGDDQRLCAGPHGELAIVDVGARSVSFVDQRGWIRWHKSSGSAADAPLRPIGACFDRDSRLHVLDAGRGEVVRFDLAGNREGSTRVGEDARWIAQGPARRGVLVGEGGRARLIDGPRQLELPTGDALVRGGNSADTLWRAGGGVVERLDATGAVQARFDGLGEVRSFARSPAGYVLVASATRGCLAVTDDGQVTQVSERVPLAVACDDRGVGYALEADEDGVVSLRVIGAGAP